MKITIVTDNGKILETANDDTAKEMYAWLCINELTVGTKEEAESGKADIYEVKSGTKPERDTGI